MFLLKGLRKVGSLFLKALHWSTLYVEVVVLGNGAYV